MQDATTSQHSSISGGQSAGDSVVDNAADKTFPAEEILNALRQLGTLPVSASQETVLENPNAQSQEGAVSSTPASEWERLRAHLLDSPNDTTTWLKLLHVAENETDFNRINETYDALLEHYPNTPSAQIAYISHVLESSSPTKYQQAAGLFNRYLKASPFVELWKFYVTYVRKMNTGSNTRDTIRKAYEYALNHIGHDKESTEIWTDYIQFLKAGESATPWDEGQKMDAIRKAYQRAVQMPIDNVKRIWEEYQEFENSLNKITAKKFLSDLQESHMQARTVLNQLQEHMTALFPPPPLSKPGRSAIMLPQKPDFSTGDKALVGRWRLYLKWEESNPLEIEEKNKAQLHARIQSLYRKALVRMRFYSEIWYMAYVWTVSLSNDQTLPENKRKERKDEAVNILKAGIVANPASFVLNFAYAEVLEDNKNFSEVHETFKKFLEILRQDLNEIESRIASANSSFSSITSSETAPSDAIPGLTPSSSQESAASTRSLEGTSSKSKVLSKRRTEYGVVWIVYMRFARRAESLQSARSVFGKARKDKWTPWEVYEAAALMEYHCTKASDVAVRIFERGLDYFSTEVDFALRYLGFLISINDDANSRALFERLVSLFPPERARPIWERWARYEYQFGNLQAAHNLERRMAEVYPNDPPIKRFAERHKYSGTDVIATRDLGFVLGRSSGVIDTARSSGNALGRTDSLNSLSVSSSQQSQMSSSRTKRQAPPERRREESRGGDYNPKRHKGPRSSSRDQWDNSSRRKYRSPSLEREREHDRSIFARRPEKEEKPVTVPPIVSWFVGALPEPTSFDGPVFRTDDLMKLFLNASIPSSTGIRARSPPPHAGGASSLEHSSYQGPTARLGSF